MEINDTLSILVSLTAAVLSLLAIVRTRETEAKRRRLEVVDYISQQQSLFHHWADKVIEQIGTAIFLCELDPKKLPSGEYFIRRWEVRKSLSTLLDQGRFFAPNTDGTSGQLVDPTEQTGFRQKPLEFVAQAINEAEKINYEVATENADIRDQLVSIRKRFYIEMQEQLKVRNIVRERQRLSNEVHQDDMP